MVTLTLTIDDDTMTLLKKEARERGTTVDDLVALGARMVVDSTGEIELTEEDEAALEAADAEIARGEFVTKEELFKKLKALRG